jgi:NAD-dependent dihydropyrimidine dehydrogenase PreA subunit
MPAIVDVEKCSGCKSCEEVCPTDAIKVADFTSLAGVSEEDCIDCNACEDACTTKAISMS